MSIKEKALKLTASALNKVAYDSVSATSWAYIYEEKAPELLRKIEK